MENIIITGKNRMPTIDFNGTTGNLVIKGISVGQDVANVVKFYRPLEEWLKEYFLAPAERTTMTVQLEWFCTSSSKCIFGLFRILEKNYLAGYNVVLNWICEKDDEVMLGNDRWSDSGLLKIPVNWIEIE